VAAKATSGEIAEGQRLAPERRTLLATKPDMAPDALMA
jgi:hypothetical protein